MAVGCLLHRLDASQRANSVQDILTKFGQSNRFEHERCALVFDTCVALLYENAPLNQALIKAQIQRTHTPEQQARFDSWFNGLSHVACEPEELHRHIDLVVDIYQRSKIEHFLEDTLKRIRRGEEIDPTQEVSDLVEKLEKIQNIASVGLSRLGSEVVPNMLDTLNTSGLMPLRRTGIDWLDDLTGGGLPDHGYLLVCAYSGHGKTTTALTIMMQLLRRDPEMIMVLYSSEMREDLMLSRCAAALSSTGNLDENTILSKPMSEWPAGAQSEYVEASCVMRSDSVHVTPPEGFFIEDIEAKIRLERMRHPEKRIVVLIDYIQDINIRDKSHKSAAECIKEATRRIKDLYNRYNALIIVCSQLTGEQGAIDGVIPMPGAHQIRESKDIKQNASLILMWHRPFIGHDNADLASVCVLKVDKNRFRRGPSPYVILDYDSNTNRLHALGHTRHPPIPQLTGKQIRKYG